MSKSPSNWTASASMVRYNSTLEYPRSLLPWSEGSACGHVGMWACGHDVIGKDDAKLKGICSGTKTSAFARRKAGGNKALRPSSIDGAFEVVQRARRSALMLLIICVPLMSFGQSRKDLEKKRDQLDKQIKATTALIAAGENEQKATQRQLELLQGPRSNNGRS
ncbi:MAG: hypothetical protein IPP33_09740 [Flavobacteriales bacterium]|nr:hypothetical protein [Flavobacteriales bacterium]